MEGGNAQARDAFPGDSYCLAPWASRRRQDLLQLLDRLTPTIAELTQAIEREVETSPEARRLQRIPGWGH